MITSNSAGRSAFSSRPVNDVRGQARAGQALAQYADGAAGGLHADDLVAGGNKRQ